MLYVLWLLYFIYTFFVVLVHRALLLCYVRPLYRCPLTQGPAPCEASFLCSISILHIWLLSLGSGDQSVTAVLSVVCMQSSSVYYKS